MWNSPEEEAQLIKSAIENADGMAHFDRILDIMKEQGSIEYTRQMAVAEADKAKAAIAILPESNYKAALLGLADIAVNRDS
jgi:octaprenyl-diphosphate synthase